MKAEQHAIAGMVAGGIAAAVPHMVEGITPPDGYDILPAVLLGCAIGTAAASIPDFLEPSKKLGPNHRGLFHSWAVLVALGAAWYAIYKGRTGTNSRLAWTLIQPAIAGYVSHLVTDMPSKKSLPLLF